MSFARSYDSFPGLTELAALEGTVVVRITPQRNPIGAGFGTLCIVGEPVNDQDSDSDKTIVNTVREITSADDIQNTYGGFSKYVGTAADGFEGNLAARLALPGIQFSRLMVIAPDLDAGTVQVNRTVAAGGAYTLPAGTRVSDGGSDIYMTLEDASWTDTETGAKSIRVRAQTSTTGDESASGITTVVDTPTGYGTFTVTNAAGLTNPSDWDAKYTAAINVLKGTNGLEGQVDAVICCRHTEAMRTSLVSLVQSRANGKRALDAFYAPPVGTSNTTAVGSSGVGVGTASSQDKRLGYCYPGIKTKIPAYSSTIEITMPSDVMPAMASSLLHPVENFASHREFPFAMGIESGLGVQPTQAQYKTWRGLGMMSPQIDAGKAEILSDRTTDTTAPNDEFSHVRTVDWLATSLHNVGAAWAKKLRSKRNERVFVAEVQSLLAGFKSEGNPDFQLIEDFAVDGVTGNTAQTKANGLYVVKVLVTTLGHMNTIVFTLEAGKTVNVSVSAQ